MVAVHRGTGALIRGNRTLGYFETVGGSYGFQAGIQAYGYALFFMDRESLQYLNNTRGWNVGSAPSLVVGNAGVSGSLGTMNLKKGIVAIFFNQRGLMGGLGLQGAKITQFHPSY
jgi:lipid-binding SYLF domain-containing protein